VNAPFTEVLAVIVEDPIPILPHARARASNDFRTVKYGLPPPAGPDAPASCELRERHFCYGTPEKTMRQTGIMYDSPISNVDPMMQIATTWRENVRARQRLITFRQEAVKKLRA